jgi:PmbA protein
MGLSPVQIIEGVVKEVKARAVDAYEVFLICSEGTSIEVKNREVDSFEVAKSLGLSARLFQNERLGFAYCSGLNEGYLNRVVEEALQGLKQSHPDPAHGLPKTDGMPFPSVPIYDEKVCMLPKEEKVARAMEMEGAALSFDKRIRKVRKSTYHDSAFEVFLANSMGADHSYRGSVVSLSIAVVAEADDSHMGWDFEFSRFFDDLDARSVGRGAAKKAVELLGGRSISSRCCPVMLESYVASQFVSALSASFLADAVQKKRSLLVGKRGQKAFSQLIAMWDDGSRAGGIATSPFDGEGVARRRTPVVKDGVVLDFLYDTYCGKRDGRASTGNSSRRDVKGPPGVGLSNFYLEGGHSSPEELVSGMGRGIVVKEVMGMHTVNPVSGDFSVGIGGLWVEGGHAKYPVRGLMLAGNLLDFFERVEALGNDVRFYGQVGAPSVLFGPTDVSGS